MNKKTPPSDDDSELFRHAMKQVTPLKKRRQAHASKRPLSDEQKQQRQRQASQFNHEQCFPYAHGHESHRQVTGSDVLHFHHNDMPERYYKQLRRGEVVVDASLDLHHNTITEAEQALMPFLRHAWLKNYYCVLIIHGKGVKLKNFVNDYLRHQQNVLAFHSAKPKHGGTGAVYVILKSNRGDRVYDE